MPAAFIRLFLVRHAEALANPDLRYLGSRDDPLTERGQWQALQLAQRLRAARAGGGLHEPAHPGRRDGEADSGGPRAVHHPRPPARRSRDGDVGRPAPRRDSRAQR